MIKPINEGDAVYLDGYRGTVEYVGYDVSTADYKYLVSVPLISMKSHVAPGAPIRIPASHIITETEELTVSKKGISFPESISFPKKGKKAMNRRAIYHCIIVNTKTEQLRDMPPIVAKSEDDAKIRTVALLEHYDPDIEEIIVEPLGGFISIKG